MSYQPPGDRRKVFLTLGAIAALCFASGMTLGLSIPPESFELGTSAALLANILLGASFIMMLAIAVVVILDAIVQATSSGAAHSAMGALKKAATDVRRPKITSTSGMSTADELEKWARLRDDGVVTQREFEAARAELLKSGGS